MTKTKAIKVVKTVKKEEIVPRILIGIPILSWTHEFAESFLAFWTECMLYKVKGRRFHIGYKFMYRKPVHMAEEELADLAIGSGCTHLLLMDDDIYDVGVAGMLKLLDADKDVIAGIMHTSGFPHSLCAFRRHDLNTAVAEQPKLKGPARLYEVPVEQRHGVVPVDLVPFCFTLIKTKVFKKIKKPWFTCNTQAPTDSWFMDTIMAKGIKPYAHFDVWLNHRGVTRYNQPLYVQLGLLENRQRLRQTIELTPEEMHKHEILMTQKIQTAEAKLKKINTEDMNFYVKKEGDSKAVLVNKEDKNGR